MRLKTQKEIKQSMENGGAHRGEGEQIKITKSSNKTRDNVFNITFILLHNMLIEHQKPYIDILLPKKAVVEKWQPLCGCDRPFEYPHCQTCPSHVEFKQRLREEIERLAI